MVLPDPDKLRQILAVARESGCATLKVSKAGDVEATWFGPADVEPATPFVDKDGKPVDLDEDLPELAREPEFGKGIDPVVQANFGKA